MAELTRPSEETMLYEISLGLEANPSFLEQVCKDADNRKLTCINCGQNGNQMKRCTACTFYYYCSVNCQRLHWNSSHKIECKKFTKQTELFPSREIVPLWYIYYIMNWTKIEEFLLEGRRHQDALISAIKSSFKDLAPVVDLLASWIPSQISIDENTKHLVIYLSYPYWNEEAQEEHYCEQQLYQFFLVGPEKAKQSHSYGTRVIDSVKEDLQRIGITVRNITHGCGFKTG